MTAVRVTRRASLDLIIGRDSGAISVKSGRKITEIMRLRIEKGEQLRLIARLDAVDVHQEGNRVDLEMGATELTRSV